MQARRDASGCLAAVVPLLEPLGPRLLFLANARGEVRAANDLLGSGESLETVGPLAEQLAARLARKPLCMFPYPGPGAGQAAFGLSVEGPEGRYVLGGVVARATRLGPLLKRQRRALAACGRLVCAALNYHDQWSKVQTENQQLRAEHNTLKAAHTEAVLEAVREREERLAVESHRWALEEFLCAAEKANQSKSEFLASISHELRTPLTAMLGYADVLLSRLKEPKDLEAAATIKRNSEFLLEIIEDVLDISKIEAGKLEVHRAPCSLLEIVGDVVDLMRLRARAKHLPLVVDLRGPLPETVQTDSTRVRQILINLLGNALKFTEAGEVRLRVQLLDQDGDNPRIRFDVIDTGIGMSPEQVEGLFQPFYQIDSPAQRQYRGTGLGLAISRRLAEMLGGEISVTSTLGRGSTFTATIAAGPLEGVPLIADPALPAPQRRGAAHRSARKLDRDCRILLVEDSPDNQRLISLILSKAGASVVTADNGQAAVQKFRALQAACRESLRQTTMATQAKRSASGSQPRATQGVPARPGAAASAGLDVVLMDIEMPVMDGRQAARRLREEGFDGPIIALTAHAMPQQIESCLAAGCDAHVAKPIDWSLLIETIHNQLKHPRRPTKPAPNADAPAPQQGRSTGKGRSQTARQPSARKLPGKRTAKPAGKSVSKSASKPAGHARRAAKHS